MDTGLKMTSINDRLAIEMQRHLEETGIPKELPRGKTSLIQKELQKKPTPATTYAYRV